MTRATSTSSSLELNANARGGLVTESGSWGKLFYVLTLALLTVPLTLLLLFGVLFLSALVEDRYLSPRAVVLSVVRSRTSTPEYAEALVARECERVLSDHKAASG